MPPHTKRRMKAAGASERAAAGLEARVPHLPSMDHVWPDFEPHANVGGAGCSGEAGRVVE